MEASAAGHIRLTHGNHITTGFEKEHLDDFYRTFTPGIPFIHSHARESGMPVYIVRDPIVSLDEIWEHLKAYRY